MNIYFDRGSNALYVLLRCELKSLSDLSAAKLVFSVNDSEYTEINFNNELLCSPYETNSAVKADADSGFVFLEAVCYIKEGLDLPAGICFSIYDSSGNASNEFELSYGAESAEEDKGSDSVGSVKTSKTTKKKSSKTQKASARKTKRSTTAFPFNRATKSGENYDDAIVEDNGSASGKKSENLNVQVSNTSADRAPLIITGSVCAFAVAAAAVYSAIKSNKNNQD